MQWTIRKLGKYLGSMLQVHLWPLHVLLIHNSTWEADKQINIPEISTDEIHQNSWKQWILGKPCPAFLQGHLECMVQLWCRDRSSLDLHPVQSVQAIVRSGAFSQCNQKRLSWSAVRLGWVLEHAGYTDCTRNSIAFTKHVTASMCTFTREIKPTKCLMKCIEIISHHVQEAQEGGGTPPTDPGTKGKNPAELSSEMQDAASLAALKFLIFWLFLAWHWEAPCSNRLWKHWSETNRSNILSSTPSPSHGRGPILGKMQGGLAAAERTLGLKCANITHFSLSSSSLTLQILLFSLWSVGNIWLQSLTFPATMFKWISLLSYHF